jgi:cytochrome c553
MMKRLLITGFLLLTGSLIANTGLAAGDLKRGAVLYKNCVNCHGENAQGKTLSDAPRLSGQYDWYLARQLQHFKDGVRGTHYADVTGQQMKPFALTLRTEEDINNVVAYINSKKAAPLPASVAGDPTAGQTSYATCMACHGANGEGNEALNAPKLAGLPDWYVARQLHSFKNGYRGVRADDTYGQQMRPMAMALNDEQINNIAAYVATMSGLTPPKPSAVKKAAVMASTSSSAEAPQAVTVAAMNQVTGEYVPYDDPRQSADASWAVCASCHGNNGQGNERLSAPRLAGQYDWYLARQLQNWKDGIRGVHPTDMYGMQMRPISMMLQDEAAISEVSAIVAGYQAPYPRATLEGSVEAGRAAYATCIACHGGDGAGNKALNAPKLAGLPDWYIARQLHHFRDGARGRNPKDTYGQQMAPMAAGLSDQTIIDLGTYIATLREGEIDTTPVVQQAAPAATAEAPAATAAVASSSDGQALYATCAGCHGADGAGNQALNAPRLAGQQAWYISRQLANFKGGVRGAHADDMYGKQMAPMSMALSPADMDAVAAYASGLTGARAAATLNGDTAAGQAGYALCAGCHGADGKGNQALNAPALNGLPDWYIARQLANFKAGIRGAHPDDVYGKQMAPMSMGLDEAAMKNISSYIITLQ